MAPKGSGVAVLVVELRCVSVDDGTTGEPSASASPPGPASNGFVATVPTTGMVTWLTVVGSDGVVPNTALTVELTGALLGSDATLEGVPTRSEPRVVTAGATPDPTPRPETLGALAGSGEASAALEKAAVRAIPTTTPATPPPRRSALRHNLPRRRAAVRSDSGSVNPGVTTERIYHV
jgi:hypothetical protein